jgi:hypothetical protein
MNKVITTAAVILCLAGSAHAGDARTSHGRSSAMASTSHTVLLGVDVDAALPVGNYGNANGFGAGALLNVEYPAIEQLSLTGRVGFQFHTNKSITAFGATIDNHVHSIPVLLGAKYYVLQQDRQGLFAAAEMGLFGLMIGASSGATSASDTQMKFGVGAGLGYQWKEWSARVNVHTHDVGNFGDAVMLTGGVGYQFAGF